MGNPRPRGHGAPPEGSQRAATTSDSRPLWADTYDDEEDEVDDEDAGEVDADGEEDPGKLREAYQGACALLKRLRAKKTRATDEIIALAARQRDDAERRWRASKPPPPVSLRLSRASSCLDRAFRAKEEAEAELAAFEATVVAQREKLQGKIASAKGRILHHQARVDDLRAEGGTISSHTPKPVLAACNAARVVGAGLAARCIPMLQAALEAAESAGPIHDEQRAPFGDIHLVLRDLHNFEQVCRRGYDEERDGAAENFNIGDDDDGDFDGEDDFDMSEVSSELRDGSPAAESRPGHGTELEEAGRGRHSVGSRWSQQRGGGWKKAKLGDEPVDEGANGGGLGVQPAPTGNSSSSGQQQAAQPPAAATTAVPATTAGSGSTGGAASDARETRGATQDELQALVQERQANGDWEATQVQLAHQAAMEEVQKRLHRAKELAEAARGNGIYFDPAAFQWPAEALEYYAKENGLQ